MLAALGLAGAGAGAGTALASAHRDPRARPAAACVPKTLRVRGHRALRECGNATATLTLGGHTYHFSGGSCVKTSKLYLVAIGTLVIGDPQHGGGTTSFDLTIDSGSSGLLEVYTGGHALTLQSPTIRFPSHTPSHGRFTSVREPDSPSYHGSWDCHGSLDSVG